MRIITFFLLLVSTGIWANSSLTRKEIQIKLNEGAHPKDIIALGLPLDSLYGMLYGGGMIFHFDTTSNKGMVVSLEDLHYRNNKDDGEIQWGCNGRKTGATGTKIGTGKSNTAKIMAQQCPLYEPDKGWLLPAAELCTLYRGGGFDDWFLPSKDELCAVYLNLKEPGHHDFHRHMYWTSSEKNDGFAWLQYFINGGQAYFIKYFGYFVRAVREF